jgi:hypothetical protein
MKGLVYDIGTSKYQTTAQRPEEINMKSKNQNLPSFRYALFAEQLSDRDILSDA